LNHAEVNVRAGGCLLCVAWKRLFALAPDSSFPKHVAVLTEHVFDQTSTKLQFLASSQIQALSATDSMLTKAGCKGHGRSHVTTDACVRCRTKTRSRVS